MTDDSTALTELGASPLRAWGLGLRSSSYDPTRRSSSYDPTRRFQLRPNTSGYDPARRRGTQKSDVRGQKNPGIN